MLKKGGLGRGLSAILPDVEEAAERIDNTASQTPEDVVTQIPVSKIDPNLAQPRKNFDQEALSALAESIRHSGILQPLLLARDGGRYTIIAGERRWRAARLANLETVPAVIRDWDEVRRQEAALVENIQREDLNPIEEAQGMRSLMDECGLTQEAVAERLGRSRPAVANLLRLLSLPQAIRAAVEDGRISAGHARVLAGVSDAPRRDLLFQKTLEMDWSVRQLEAAARKAEEPPQEKPKKVSLPPEYGQLCERMRGATGMKTTIEGNEQKGRVILSYGSQEELQRLWDILGPSAD